MQHLFLGDLCVAVRNKDTDPWSPVANLPPAALAAAGLIEGPPPYRGELRVVEEIIEPGCRARLPWERPRINPFASDTDIAVAANRPDIIKDETWFAVTQGESRRETRTVLTVTLCNGSKVVEDDKFLGDDLAAQKAAWRRFAQVRQHNALTDAHRAAPESKRQLLTRERTQSRYVTGLTVTPWR